MRGLVHSLAALVLGSLTVSSAGADSIWPTVIFSKLSRAEKHGLEQAACRPLNVRLDRSYATDFDDDRKEFNATAICKRHAKIDEHPVIFIRSCKYTGRWSCDPPEETVLANFSDRRVEVTAEGVPLAEATQVVRYFVSHRLIERGDIRDVSLELEPSSKAASLLPLDNCGVREINATQLELECQLARRWVARISEQDVVRYRQIPLPECVAMDNPACLMGP